MSDSPSVSNIFSLTTKRVTDLVLEQSRAAFKASGIALDAKMVSIVTLLHQVGPTTSTRLSASTGLSRQLVESRLRRLVSDGYLEERKDHTDQRMRVYSIDPQRREDVERALLMLSDLERVYESLWRELGSDVHAQLRCIEAALEERPLTARLEGLRDGRDETTDPKSGE